MTADAAPSYRGLQRASERRHSSVRTEVVEEVPWPVPFSCRTTYEICDPPLRGGVEIDGPAACTGGFVVRSRSNHREYLLTAGHCVQNAMNCLGNGTPRSGTFFTGFDEWLPIHRPIGSGYKSRLCPPFDDEAIILIDDPNYWQLPRRTAVLIQQWNGARPANRAEWYEITEVSNSSAGLPANAYLCMTGATHDTRCLPFGRIRGNFGVLNVPTGGLGACNGDSGGPVYAYHKGYGIIHGGGKNLSNFTRDRWFRRSQTVECATQGGEVHYMSLIVSLRDMNVELIP